MKLKQAELGVAVVGLGVGASHAHAYLSTGRCSLRWLYDLDPEKSKRLASELKTSRVASSFKDFLEDPEVQVVSIASYDDAHSGQVVQALRAGKHVFVEKPLCRSLEELRTVKETWEASGGLHLASNLVLRAAPLYQWLKRSIEEGRLGRLFAFDGDYLYGRMEKITHGWRKEVENYSVMQGGGVHLVDLMIFLTGEHPISVWSVGNKIATQGTDFRYPDYVAAMYQFPSGLIGRITANFGCVHRHQHAVRAFGTQGTFLYDDQGARLHLSRDPQIQPERLHDSAFPSTKGDLIPQFIDSILQGKDTRDQTKADLGVLSACLAADRALALGKPVQVEYL